MHDISVRKIELQANEDKIGPAVIGTEKLAYRKVAPPAEELIDVDDTLYHQ